jgi:saccharopine dehydrogenase-like NADP-dependent oxidoreductase
MKQPILLFGAGKSAGVLIDYLLQHAPEDGRMLWIADARTEHIRQRLNNNPYGKTFELDIHNSETRSQLIAESALVISMMPPALHTLIATDCLKHGKSLLTASYLDDTIKSMHAEVEQKGLLFLCEMGLDPGIDHMSALQLINSIKAKGGHIQSFKSHCGGLVSPESDNNPWHYKISWNPRNVVLAGKAGALYRQHNQTVQIGYQDLFVNPEQVTVSIQERPTLFSYYPNRNSLPYIDMYELPTASTFVRTTLRHPDFMRGWNHLIQLGFTSESPLDDFSGNTFADFFRYMEKKNGQSLHTIDDSPLWYQQLDCLGYQNETAVLRKPFFTIADILQQLLESSLSLSPTDNDMIVMLHELEYTLDEIRYGVNSSLVVTGRSQSHTAMAETVGMPLGIAARLILNGVIQQKGVCIPTAPSLYQPVMTELEKTGIRFTEITRQLD